jgi:anti-sigma B factor antagonist
VSGEDRVPPRFGWSVSREGGDLVIAAEGEMDLANADEFGGVVRAQLAGGPVVLDLSGLTFMDSSGVRMLDGLLREVDREGRRLRVAPELQPPVRQVLEMTGLLAVLPLR